MAQAASQELNRVRPKLAPCRQCCESGGIAFSSIVTRETSPATFTWKRVMMRQPTLFLTVGLPCTGKTTAARRIEIEQKALRLTKDEWVKALYGHENPPSAQDVIEGRLIQIGLRALELGNNVVIDYGLWGRDERSALRQAAADLGAMVEMRYFELTPAEQRRRLDQRQAEAPHTTWPMSDEELAEFDALTEEANN